MTRAWYLAAFLVVFGCYAEIAHSSHRIEDRPADLLPLQPTSCQVDELAESVTEIFGKFFTETHYDSSVYYLEESLPFDSYQIFRKYGTANCVGVAEGLKEQLRGYADFKMIPAVLPRYYRRDYSPVYDHVALIAFCQDGLVLLDTTMNFHQVITLKGDRPFTVYSNGGEQWRMSVDSLQSKINVTLESMSGEQELEGAEQESSEWYWHYDLAEITNADEAITLPIFQRYQKLLIFKMTTPEEPFFRLLICLDSRKVEFWRMGLDGSDEKVLSLRFEDYYADPLRFKRKIREETRLEGFKIKLDLLIDRISQILDLPQFKQETR